LRFEDAIEPAITIKTMERCRNEHDSRPLFDSRPTARVVGKRNDDSVSLITDCPSQRVKDRKHSRKNQDLFFDDCFMSSELCVKKIGQCSFQKRRSSRADFIAEMVAWID
jgi:hypothetical protein